jgi:hypothetical protein
MLESRELRIEPPNTTIVNEYRLNGSNLEIRIRDRANRYYPAAGTIWRSLTTDELNNHVALNTVVAQWMSSKLWRSRQTD